MKTTHEEAIRENVRKAYARAVTSAGAGQGSCGCRSNQKARGAVSKFAGYEEAEMSRLPEDAVVSSFGCGNPVALSQIKEGETVLDLGSGAGLDLLLAAEKVGPSGRVIGIDMTPEMIDRARENFARAGLKNAEVRKGIIEEMPVESGTVDWVISNCVINLSPQKPKVFSEIFRVLKPGGHMLISDIMVKDLPEWVRGIQALYDSCIGGAISEEEYLAGLKKAGMTSVEVVSRIVYDETQMAALADSEVSEVKSVMSCCGQIPNEELRQIVASASSEMKGKIWSATVYSEKPSP